MPTFNYNPYISWMGNTAYGQGVGTPGQWLGNTRFDAPRTFNPSRVGWQPTTPGQNRWSPPALPTAPVDFNLPSDTSGFMNYLRSWMKENPETTTRTLQSSQPYQFPAIRYPTPGTNVTGGSVSGSATNWTPEYGGVPNVANPLMGEAGALTGNLANFPLISSMAGGVNQLQQGQLLANYEQAFPGFGSNMAAGSAGIAHDLAGTVDPSEFAQMAIGAAGRGLAMGQPGSTPMTNAAYLSAIGQTAAQRRALGQQELNARIAATPVVQPYDITRDLISGPQLTEAANMANLYASAPVPTAAAAEEQRMADLAMSRGLTAQDWLAERNFGRSQQEQAQNFQRQLQSMVLGGQLSEEQANRAWQRAMAYMKSQPTPQQNRPWSVPNLYSYNRRSNPSEFYSDISFAGGPPGTVGGPTTLGMLTPEQTKAYYDAWYGSAAPAVGTPTSYYDPLTDTSNQYPVSYYNA